MGRLLYLIVVFLVVLWLAGFLFWHIGHFIHLLLVVAVIVVLVRLLQR